MENNIFSAVVSENNILSVNGSAVSDSVKFVKIHFSFPKTWDGFTKTVTFKNADIKCSVLLNEKNELCTGTDECYIPFEVLKIPAFTFAVYGISEDRKATTSWATIRVLKGCGETGDKPSKPTPTDYEQLISLLNNPLANPLTETITGISVVKAEEVSPTPQYLKIKVGNEDGTQPEEPVKLYMYGRNLIPYPYDISESITVNGITFTDNGDGTITANGTAEDNIVYAFEPQEKIVIPKGTYSFGGCPVYGDEETNAIVMVMHINNEIAHTAFCDGKALNSKINTSGTPSFEIWINKGVVADNLVFKPQLEAGQCAYDYEPYKQPKAILIDPQNPEPVLSEFYPAFTLLSEEDGIKISFEYILNLNSTMRNMWKIIKTDAEIAELTAKTVKLMADALAVAFKRNEETFII